MNPDLTRPKSDKAQIRRHLPELMNSAVSIFRLSCLPFLFSWSCFGALSFALVLCRCCFCLGWVIGLPIRM